MVTSTVIKNRICSYELPLSKTNPPRIDPSLPSDSLIRPGESVFCIFSESEGDVNLKKIIRPDSDFQETYESTAKETNLYIVEGNITIEENDLYLSNLKIWDVFQVAEE